MRTPPTETITVARADETTTEGRRLATAPTTVGTVQALVEPCAYDRTDTAGRRTITHGCNLLPGKSLKKKWKKQRRVK